MHNQEIKVFCLAEPHVNSDEMYSWLDNIGVSEEYELPVDDGYASQIAFVAGKRCYKSFEPGINPNVEHCRNDLTSFIDNILKSGHGSVLEHGMWTFAIEGVTRVFTGEMNRHRAGIAISEGSMRYIRFDDIGWWFPNSLLSGNKLLDDGSGRLEEKQQKTKEIFDEVFQFIEEKYKVLTEDVWKVGQMKSFDLKKKVTSLCRRIIPMGTSTGGIWSFNMRALRHVLTVRLNHAAEEEIQEVCRQIWDIMRDSKLLQDFVEKDGFLEPKYVKV